MAANSKERSWATAIARNGERAIVFRYIANFGSKNPKSQQPDRILIVWSYDSEEGMPSPTEREQMDALEDCLAPFVEVDDFATLALVSTGEDFREWMYYTKSADDFLERLNVALTEAPRFPIEIHANPDPDWSSYERFRSGVQE